MVGRDRYSLLSRCLSRQRINSPLVMTCAAQSWCDVYERWMRHLHHAIRGNGNNPAAVAREMIRGACNTKSGRALLITRQKANSAGKGRVLQHRITSDITSLTSPICTSSE